MLSEINVFLLRHDMAETKFGRLAVGDPRLIGDLRNGRDLRPNTKSRVRAFMEGYGK